MTFVAEDPEEHLLLAHCVGCEQSAFATWWPVLTRTVIEDLKAGRSDVLGHFASGHAVGSPTSFLERSSNLSGRSISSRCRRTFSLDPAPYATRALQSLFRVRLIGEGVDPGRTSAADVRMAAQAAETSLKTLAEITLKQRKQSGRPTRQIRYYSDLPVQYLGAASFEINLRPPDTSHSHRSG